MKRILSEYDTEHHIIPLASFVKRILKPPKCVIFVRKFFRKVRSSLEQNKLFWDGLIQTSLPSINSQILIQKERFSHWRGMAMHICRRVRVNTWHRCPKNFPGPKDRSDFDLWYSQRWRLVNKLSLTPFLLPDFPPTLLPFSIKPVQ